MHATVEHVAGGRRVVVRAAGDVDVHTAAVLRARLTTLIDAGVDDVIVDLTQVAFMDSTGLGVLVGARARLQESGGRLVVVIEDEGLLSILRVAALARLLGVRRSLAAALSEEPDDRRHLRAVRTHA